EEVLGQAPAPEEEGELGTPLIGQFYTTVNVTVVIFLFLLVAKYMLFNDVRRCAILNKRLQNA
ncbi:MAG TPA: hypothetical protein VEC17_03685, partial [Candidatus Binatia bacterium]|nr:hypothetical protein [Candidatus Binatia bacterium]